MLTDSPPSPARRRLPRIVAALAGAALAIGTPVVVATPAAAANTSYYVDCSAGTNGSGTQASPWNGVAAVNAPTFGAGDRILFKAGTTCVGQVAPKGSGAAGNPIRMGAYGTGAKPIIDAVGAVGAVITLRNVQQWEVSGLELRNQASTPDYRAGLFAENSSGGLLRHIVVTNMTIRNISGWSGGWYATNAGIGIQTNHTSTTSTYDDIVIADNTFDRVDRIAIAVTPDRDGEGTGLTTNVKIQRNNIRYSGGDDILVVKGQGALIEGNDAAFGGTKSIDACPPSGQYCNGASAGIWMSGSLDTVVQGNSVVCHVNEADGQGYDVDWGNRNTLVQYNYSRNNRGGFILMMPPINVSGEPTSAIPSDGTVLRYNVSEDDANASPCPVQPRWEGPRDIFHFAGSVPNRSDSSVAQPDIYNNTIYVPQGRATYVIGSRSGVNTNGSFRFRNNLVVNFGSGGYVNTNGSTYANNVMYGNRHSTEPANAGTITLDPQLVGPAPSGATGIAGAQSYRLRASSPALRAGVAIAGNGGRDFAGTALPSTAPTVGAFEGVTGNLVANGGFDTGAVSPWNLSGNGAAAALVTTGQAQGTHALRTGPSNSGAEQTVSGLVSGATYLLSATMRVATGGEQLALGVKAYGGADVFSHTTSTTYAPVSQYFTMGATATSATVFCYKNSGSGNGFCDGVSLQRVTSPGNLAANAGFESGTLSPWTLSGSGAASSVSATGARTGAHGLVTGASNSGANQTVTGLSPATTYVVSGWLRAAAGEDIALGVKDAGQSEASVKVAGALYAPATLVFTTGSSTTSATIYCYKNAGSSAGACDDIRVTKLG